MASYSLTDDQIAKAMSVSLQAIAISELENHIRKKLEPYIKEWVKNTLKNAGVVRAETYHLPSGAHQLRFVVELETNEDPFTGH